MSRPVVLKLRGVAIWAGAMVLALAAFQLMFGLRLVSAHDPYWLNPFGDMMTNLAGAEAVFRGPWTFPLPVTRALTEPQPLSTVYTDSLPWMTVAMKALGLHGAFNVLGLFMLLSYLAQPVGMIALMRACGVESRVALAAGAVLSLLLPAWLIRQFGHIALTAHWIVLASLAVAVASAREGLTPRRVLWFCLLGAVAIGTHAYFIVTVAAMFAAALASEITQRRPGAAGRCAVAALRFSLAVGASAFVLGYDVGLGAHTAASLGFYSMNLLGPFWPHPSRLAGQSWDPITGWFTGGMDATGGQAFEGLNYLGAGVVLLMLLALGVALARGRPRLPQSEAMARFGPLAATLVLLTLLAVGPKAYLGPWPVWSLPLPTGRVGDALGLFRAHGRFFWACGYMMLALSLAVLARRLRPRTLAAIAVIAVAVQLFDVSILLAAVRERFEAPFGPRYPAQLDSAQINGRPWMIYPTYFCSDDAKEQWIMSQVVWLAMRRGGTANTSNTARPVGGACTLPADLTQTAKPDDRRITLVLDRAGRHGRLPNFAARSDCTPFASGLVCGVGIRELLAAGPAP